MSHHERELVEIDAMRGDLARGLLLRVVGWTLLAFDGIIVIFVWTGWRAGSNFWAYWTVIEGALGLALIMAGNHYKSRAGTEIIRPREEDKAA